MLALLLVKSWLYLVCDVGRRLVYQQEINKENSHKFFWKKKKSHILIAGEGQNCKINYSC